MLLLGLGVVDLSDFLLLFDGVLDTFSDFIYVLAGLTESLRFLGGVPISFFLSLLFFGSLYFLESTFGDLLADLLMLRLLLDLFRELELLFLTGVRESSRLLLVLHLFLEELFDLEDSDDLAFLCLSLFGDLEYDLDLELDLSLDVYLFTLDDLLLDLCLMSS